MALGAAIDFSGVSLPFTVSDLLSSGNALLGLVGTFILLGLAFKFVPKIISLIGFAFAGTTEGQRDEYGNRVHFQSREAKAYFEKYKKEQGW
jgi:hypothetical protein